MLTYSASVLCSGMADQRSRRTDITLTQSPDQHLDPLRSDVPQTAFDAQLQDPNSPLFLDQDLPNSLLHIMGTRSGLDTWSEVVGLRREDLFGICAALFLIILAVFIGVAVLLFLIDFAFAKVFGSANISGGRRRSTGDGIIYAQKRDEYDEYDSKASRPTPSPQGRQPWYRGLAGVSPLMHAQAMQGALAFFVP